MTVEAHITPVWRKQKLLLALLLLGFGGWFIFDGAIGWPKSNERWKEHQRLKADEAAWKEFAKSKGWSAEPPHRLYEKNDLLMQFILGGICSALGAGTLLYWLSQLKRTVKLDGDVVFTATGEKVPLSAITGVGKKLWEKKGIAKIRYTLDGKNGEFVVDDYKFETKPSRQILDAIEKDLLARS